MPRRWRWSWADPLALALDRATYALAQLPSELGESFDRRGAETAKAWLARVRQMFDAKNFREGVGSKEAATQVMTGAAPLRVRIAAAAALAESQPELVEAAMGEMADERVVRVARAALAKDDDALIAELEAL